MTMSAYKINLQKSETLAEQLRKRANQAQAEALTIQKEIGYFQQYVDGVLEDYAEDLQSVASRRKARIGLEIPLVSIRESTLTDRVIVEAFVKHGFNRVTIVNHTVLTGFIYNMSQITVELGW